MEQSLDRKPVSHDWSDHVNQLLYMWLIMYWSRPR